MQRFRSDKFAFFLELKIINYNVMETPKVLYHYTTINTLALILKAKTIRLSRADSVNDKREGATSDYGSLAQYVFISCWTETMEENIALWNMYTPKMRGVRIELPMPIFEVFKFDDIYDCIIPAEKIVDENQGFFILPNKEVVYRITYTNDEDLLAPNVIAKVAMYEGLKISDIGLRKKTIWEFENEWRFRLNIFPIDRTVVSEFFPDKISHLIENKVPPPISDYMIKIKDASFEKMKIRISPRLAHGDLEIIEALISKYNPSASLEDSSLKHDIR